LIIAPVTLYSFFVGSFFALVWCLVALASTMFIQTPNTSLFPEIDVAAKIGIEDTHDPPQPFAESRSLIDLLFPLSNAGSLTIRHAMRGTHFYARFSEREYEGTRRVVLVLQDNGLQLSKGVMVVNAEKRLAAVEEGDDRSTAGEDNRAGGEDGYGPGRNNFSTLDEFVPGPFGAYRTEPYQADPMTEEFRDEFRDERVTPPPEMSSRYM
jgi:hypothetical protein